MDVAVLKKAIEDAGEKSFRFTQAFHAVYKQLISDWDEATTLPPSLRAHLKVHAPIQQFEVVREVEAEKGDTRKAALKLPDGNLIETVLMRHAGGRNTVCVSSQAGCPMACTFCATGTMGLKRNLTTGEIVAQVLHFSRLLAAQNERVTNMVFMGMGEPMHNYSNVMDSIRIFNDQKGLGLGARHISISTCGIVAGINRMADEPLQVNLAISLHAPNDALRTRLMPVNRAYPLAKLMASLDAYIEKTGRKVMFEYLLIDGLNDTPEVMAELGVLMKKPLYHVNLIKYHTTGAFVSSPRDRRTACLDELKKAGVSVTHRITFGEDIDAACGQLANKGDKKVEAPPMPARKVTFDRA